MFKHDLSKSNKTLPSIEIQSPLSGAARTHIAPTFMAAMAAVAVLTAKKGVAQLFWKIIKKQE